MRRRRRAGFACALALALLAPLPLRAHVSLVAAEPARNSTMDAAPAELRLRFSGTIEQRYTSVTLLAPDGSQVPLGTVTFVAGSDREFTAAVPPIRMPGSYTVRWRTAGADGHVLEGSYSFTLTGDAAAWQEQAGAAPPGEPAAAAPAHDHADDVAYDDAGTPLDVRGAAARWLHFLALLLLAGALAFRALLLPRLPAEPTLRAEMQRSAWRGVAFAALLLVAAAVLRLWAQSAALHGADRAWDGQLLSLMLSDTNWGRAWLAQALLLALLGAAIVAARPPRDRGALLLAVPAVLGLAAIPALTGHAAGAERAVFVVLNDALHVLAAGAWLGTLAVIVVAALPIVRRRSVAAGGMAATLVERFSPLALLAAATVVLTGVINSALHLRSPADLLETQYGQVLLVKVGLFALVAAAGVVNWRVVRPALLAGGDARRLRLTGGVELLLSLLVLGATAVLTGIARP